jgi:predicted nucleotidyltransferase
MLLQLQEVLEEFPEYVIIGGIAAALLGVPRTTADVDVVILTPIQEAEQIVRLFEQHNFQPGPDAVAKLRAGRPAKFAFSRRFSVDVRLASFRLDQMAIQRAQVIPLFGFPLRIATPEDLIVYKLASWQALDREDIRHVLQHFGESLDTAYLEEQIGLLAQEAGLPDLMKRWSSIREGGPDG